MVVGELWDALEVAKKNPLATCNHVKPMKFDCTLLLQRFAVLKIFKTYFIEIMPSVYIRCILNVILICFFRVRNV